MSNRNAFGRFQNNNDINVTHGFRKHPHYRRWIHMIDRCTNVNNKSYSDYGGRGIDVCAEWSRGSGPKAFCEWADETYTSGLVLDRRDNSKGYFSENCRWVDWSVSNKNKRPRKTYTATRVYKRKHKLPKGVYQYTGTRYRSQIVINSKSIHLGVFDTPEEASKAFELARSKLRPGRDT